MKQLRGLWVLFLMIGLMASPRAVIADDPDPDDGYTPQPDTPPAADISVQSHDDGVTIYISITDTSPGSPGDVVSDGDGTGGNSSAPSCTADVMNVGLGLLEWLMAEAPLHPGAAPWTVHCDDGFFGVVWVPINTDPADVQVVIGAPDPIDPLSVAAELRDRLAVPEMAISANPDTGLVALPSWFWVDGYDGTPISSSTTLGGITVEVQIVPQRYTWSFGDGGTLETTSPGEPYPAESDIQHSYEQSSLGAGGAFVVTVEISFSAQYRVNGDAWQSLDAITRSFTIDYPVQQLQSVLTED
jgi:hypothetical protein